LNEGDRPERAAGGGKKRRALRAEKFSAAELLGEVGLISEKVQKVGKIVERNEKEGGGVVSPCVERKLQGKGCGVTSKRAWNCT